MYYSMLFPFVFKDDHSPKIYLLGSKLESISIHLVKSDHPFLTVH